MANEGGARRDPLVVGLLAAIAVLLTVQLAFQALVILRVHSEAEAMRPSLDRALAQLDVVNAKLDSQAPAQIARGADEVARDTLGKVREFTARRAALDRTPRGPLEKIDHMTELMKLLADELAALLQHFAMTQGVLAQPGLDGDAGKPPPEKP